MYDYAVATGPDGGVAVVEFDLLSGSLLGEPEVVLLDEGDDLPTGRYWVRSEVDRLRLLAWGLGPEAEVFVLVKMSSTAQRAIGRAPDGLRRRATWTARKALEFGEPG